MIDNNIVQALGAGSGIDTNSLVKQLTAIERAAPQERIDSKRDIAETQISDFGLLSSALSTLKDAATLLTDPEGLFSKTASFTDSDALVPTELGTDVQAGTYAFTVSQIAQSQSLAYTGFADPTDSVGEGTLSFSFGSWARDNDGLINGGFTLDAEQDLQTITIDSSNNSLTGLRDAINDADFGVTASIIFDGNNYNLTLLAASGEEKQLEITATESGAPGLANFAFNTGVSGFESLETQGGRNAELTINGLSVSRASNTIDDIVEGLSLDILQETAIGEIVTVTVSDDKDFAEQNVRGFVDAYNAFLEAVDPIFGITEVENDEGETQTVVGSLANDGLAKSALTQIRSLIASSVPGLSDSNLTSLTNIGIRTELDGTLSIEENDFTSAFDDNFNDVQKLLSNNTSSTSDQVLVNSFSENTVAGEYEVVITQAPTKGEYTGGAFAGISFPLDTSGKTYTFEIDVNSSSSGTITIPTATYAAQSDLASAIQAAINADNELSENGDDVVVTFNGTGFDITSNEYGTTSNVSITAASADSVADLGLAVQSGTAGLTVAGTVNGVAGFGSANVLLPALGEPGEGLAMIVGENASASTVNFSRGFAGELETLVDEFLNSQGPIALRNETLNDQLETLDADEEKLDRRISSYEERLIQQYIAMERIINSLNSSGSFLDDLINTLPFTSGNDR